MKKVKITKQILSRAQTLFEFHNLKNSITKGEGELAGAIGEVIVEQFYSKHKVERENTYDYDLIIKDKKIDVKTKKFAARFSPNKNWTINVSDFNTKQKCDFYCFVGVADDYSIAYIYGFISKEEFYNVSTFGKCGEVDPNGNGSWTFKSDCYCIPMSLLKK